jgi:hypothetical protein
MNPTLKLTEQVAADIRARIKSMDFGAIEKIRKAKEENGTFDVIISTEDIDRSGEIVKQNGWELANYKNNPIVLWGHDYYSLPVGVCTETYLTEKNGVPALGAKGVFLSAEINPFAQQVRKLYEFGIGKGAGVGCTTSVGFIPKEFDDKSRNTITKAELLEFSFVPIPANQGVGPAQGRALTFDEAKELSLDVAGLRIKGIEFVEAEKSEEPEKKEAQAGDDCSMDDGGAGALASDPKDPDGALVCVPKSDDKGEKADAGRSSQKKLIKAIGDEHERHAGEIEKAFDDFREKSAVVEDQGDPAEPNGKAKKDNNTEVMRECFKDLRDALKDEHTMHRANSVKCFRSFDPSEDKAFDKNPHLKALRGAHDDYEQTSNKALDEFEERCMKSEQGSVDEHADWITGKMDEAQRGHKKAVVKTAKAMCKDAFGEEEQADEKTLEILKEYLAPHVDPMMLNAISAKIGARISAETKKQLGEAHEHLKSAKAILEALHGGLADGDGEEGRSGDDGKSTPAPEKPRSKPRQSSRSEDDALKAHLQAREIVGGIEAVAREALGKLNTEIRSHGKK